MGVSATGGRRPRHDPARGIDEATLLAGLIAGAVQRPEHAAGWLLERFGSLADVLSDHAHSDVALIDCGEGRLALRLTHLSQLCDVVLRSTADDAIRLGSIGALARLLRHDMIDLPIETFRVFFLRGDNSVIEDRQMWTGTIDHVQVHPREVVRAAVAIGAAAVILAHNHPCGSAAPSEGDVRSTRGIVEACALLGIVVHDHVIVARDGFFSMRAAGLLPDAAALAHSDWTLAA